MTAYADRLAEFNRVTGERSRCLANCQFPDTEHAEACPGKNSTPVVSTGGDTQEAAGLPPSGLLVWKRHGVLEIPPDSGVGMLPFYSTELGPEFDE